MWSERLCASVRPRHRVSWGVCPGSPVSFYREPERAPTHQLTVEKVVPEKRGAFWGRRQFGAGRTPQWRRPAPNFWPYWLSSRLPTRPSHLREHGTLRPPPGIQCRGGSPRSCKLSSGFPASTAPRVFIKFGWNSHSRGRALTRHLAPQGAPREADTRDRFSQFIYDLPCIYRFVKVSLRLPS